MSAFPTYDPLSDAIHLNGCAVILLTVLMKSKFGERFDPEMLFHPGISTLIGQLQAATGVPKPSAGECFNRVDLLTIAENVLWQSPNIGWWAMPSGMKHAFLQSAAAPWVLSEEQLETITEDVEDRLSRHRELVATADAADEVR